MTGRRSTRDVATVTVVGATALTDLKPASIAWARRKASFLDTVTRFKRDRLAVVGLVVLVIFALLALFAPLIADSADLTRRQHGRTNPKWASPSSDFIMGTDNFGRSVAVQFVYGSRISLFVGLMATILTIAIGSVFGIVAGFSGKWVDAHPDADHRLVPGHPVPAAGHRPGDGPRTQRLEHHHRHRHHLVAVGRASDPRSGA